MLCAAVAVLIVSLLLNAPAAATSAADLTPKEASAMSTPNTEHAYLDQKVEQLSALGFPLDYARPLAVLSLAHPNWRFEPILVPESWEEILYYEVDENPARSLITKNESYAAYRHETNTALYDTGHYQASHAAVSYFMDPRNFLNEADIFQFYCYAQDDEQPDLLCAVQSVLRGTFMEDADAGDGETYAQVFVRIGEELGLNALYLAVRARQEQGSYGGMTVGGDAGVLLADWIAQGIKGAPASTDEDLSRYDGYYNVFNIKASGTGSYTVLREAMLRAMAGTPEMSEAWGSSGAWDTPAKSIYGGALFIRNSYFANGQNTAYLQKYNVAPESTRRFWGQYMQNIVAALSEGRSLYRAYAQAGALELSATFRIPVYVDLPSSCPDPAQSGVDYTATSDGKYQISGSLSLNGQLLTLPEHYPTLLARGDIVTVQTTRGELGALSLQGTLRADGRITRVVLLPVAIDGDPIEATATVLYDRPEGCDALQLHCRLSSTVQAPTGSTVTYLLLLTTGEQNLQAHTIPVALWELREE